LPARAGLFNESSATGELLGAEFLPAQKETHAVIAIASGSWSRLGIMAQDQSGGSWNPLTEIVKKEHRKMRIGLCAFSHLHIMMR
jgi:hypothetical protein